MSDKSSSFSPEKASESDVRRVILLAVPPAMELDVVGPVSVFEAVNRMPERRGPALRTELVTTGQDRTIPGHAGISLLAHRLYREIREEVDTLLVVGGDGARTTLYEELCTWLR